jgi:hypothetical protein
MMEPSPKQPNTDDFSTETTDADYIADSIATAFLYEQIRRANAWRNGCIFCQQRLDGDCTACNGVRLRPYRFVSEN